jgi:hypothetical protein
MAAVQSAEYYCNILAKDTLHLLFESFYLKINFPDFRIRDVAAKL